MPPKRTPASREAVAGPPEYELIIREIKKAYISIIGAVGRNAANQTVNAGPSANRNYPADFRSHREQTIPSEGSCVKLRLRARSMQSPRLKHADHKVAFENYGGSCLQSTKSRGSLTHSRQAQRGVKNGRKQASDCLGSAVRSALVSRAIRLPVTNGR